MKTHSTQENCSNWFLLSRLGRLTHKGRLFATSLFFLFVAGLANLSAQTATNCVTVICPPNVVTNFTCDDTFTPAAYPLVVSNRCTNVQFQVSCNPPPGTPLPVGNNPIHCEVYVNGAIVGACDFIASSAMSRPPPSFARATFLCSPVPGQPGAARSSIIRSQRPSTTAALSASRALRRPEASSPAPPRPCVAWLKIAARTRIRVHSPSPFPPTARRPESNVRPISPSTPAATAQSSFIRCRLFHRRARASRAILRPAPFSRLAPVLSSAPPRMRAAVRNASLRSPFATLHLQLFPAPPRKSSPPCLATRIACRSFIPRPSSAAAR